MAAQEPRDVPAAEEPRRATAAEVAKAVFWSFFGVRKRKDYVSDSANIRPFQIVIAGLIGGAIFVLSLIGIVKLVTSQAA
jgi:hypothetical protein